MARLLNATGYVSSVLATVCLILALIAAPIGTARADMPPSDGGLQEECDIGCKGSYPQCGVNAASKCRPSNKPQCASLTCRIILIPGMDFCECSMFAEIP